MKTISLTIPMDHNALTRASDMLHGMAIDLSKEAPVVTGTAEEVQGIKATVVEAGPGVVTAEPAAAEVFAPKSDAAPTAEVQQKADLTQAPATPATALAPAPAPSVTEAATQTQTTSEAPVQTATEAAPYGVDLDGEGLPWDHRIHASSKAKLAKKPNGWKKKRGVDAETIAQVEAELREAMAAGPANPVVTTPTPSVFDTPTPAPAAATPATPAPAAAPAGVTTFPALMAAMTGAGYTAASPEVTAALNSQGLQALPLLAARPDLIPAVALALGV
jgi:uncharacterized membrane protein YkoI